MLIFEFNTLNNDIKWEHVQSAIMECCKLQQNRHFISQYTT